MNDQSQTSYYETDQSQSLTTISGNFIIPDNSASGDREFSISDSEEFMLGCPGTSFSSDSDLSLLHGQCSSGDLEISGSPGTLEDMGCERQPVYTTQIVGE